MKRQFQHIKNFVNDIKDINLNTRYGLWIISFLFSSLLFFQTGSSSLFSYFVLLPFCYSSALRENFHFVLSWRMTKTPASSNDDVRNFEKLEFSNPNLIHIIIVDPDHLIEIIIWCELE